jgi:hypothetical protein
MDAKIQHGYLVLADISGYTAYLAGTELEHAHEILTELLELIVERFKITLTLAKLEGDAVFAYVPEARISRGESLLELIESTYIAFRDRREAAHRRTTCTCQACRNIPTLDLKFLLHFGDYILQNVSGITELAGSDVNLIHRLLKNHVSEATGWRAYALFTAVGLQHLGVQPEDLYTQAEAYEHLGEVTTYSQDLHARYDALVAARRVFITPAESDLVIVQDLPASPQVVWDWINDPFKRIQWDDLDEVRPILRLRGRDGAGARNHCVHGKTISVEDVLDWRPFDYFTVRICRQGICANRTCHLVPLESGQGTRLSTNFFMESFLPAWLTRRLARPFLEKFIHVQDTRAHMARLIAAEASPTASDSE